MKDIAYQNKDIASKMTGEALVGKSLGVFGLPHLKVTGILPTNLPAVESNELRLDNLFLFSDGSVGIIDYESEYNRENFIKYLNYIARVIKRYAKMHQLEELEQIKMIVIYTADVERADDVYDLGGLVMTVESAFLIHQDTDVIYGTLEEKTSRREPLTEEELLQMMILPLTVKGKKRKQEFVVKAVELSRRMPDHEQAIRALAGILTFSDKIIDEDYKQRIKEEMRMTQIGQMIYNDGVRDGIQTGRSEGKSEGITEGKQEKARFAARNLYAKGFSAAETAETIGETCALVSEWYAEWEKR